MHTETNSTDATTTTTVAPVAPAAAKPAKRARKAKAAKPAKPAATGADKQSANRDRCLANAAIVKPHYSGPSLATHRSAPPQLAAALQRIASPVQCAKSATPRDESGIALCARHADKAGTFCPVAATADLGVLSRLASLGLIAVSGDKRARLTKAGRDLAAIVAKRAA